VHQDTVIAESQGTYRVLETSHPPVYYIPPKDVRMELLMPKKGNSFCEWKGQARYYDLNTGGQIIEDVAWSYPDPTQAFREIKDYLAFYAFKVDACYVDDERVTPQPGKFYGGWITKDVVGPFKGERNTMLW
jgi:uncharacterized protein (DUF427 family)